MVCMLIIPEVMKDTANALAREIDPTNDTDTFVKPLRLIGSAVITHRYSGPNLVDPQIIAAIRQLAQSTEFAGGIYHECGPENVRAEFDALIAAHGLEEIPVDAEG